MTIHNPAFWMRHGDLTDAGNDYRAMTTVPTLSTDGVPIPPDYRAVLANMMLKHTAAGARTFTAEVYGYKPEVRIQVSSAWVLIAGAGGWAHLGDVAVSEAADGAECHLLEAISGFTRLAARITGATGTPSVWADFGFSNVQDKKE